MSARPLHTLRLWIQHRDDIDESEAGFLKVGNEKLDLSSHTEYVEKRGGGDNTYILNDIWFFWKNSGLQVSDYNRACHQSGHRFIIFQDQSEIVQWLKGETDHVAGIKVETEEAEPEVAETTTPAVEETTAVYVEEQKVEQVEQTLVQEEDSDHDDAATVTTETVPVSRGPEVVFDRIRTIDSVLLSVHDFSEMHNIQQILDRRHEADRHGPSSSANPSWGNGGSILRQGADGRSQGRYKNYIILVPRTNQSRVNITNVKHFLNDGVWEPPTADPRKIEDSIVHKHSVTMHSTTYEIVAKEDLLKEDDWSRVVAIFLCGKAWQIKNYRPNDAAHLFANTCGIYVHWKHEQVPPEISNWRIRKFQIDQATRHGDATVVDNIWREIEQATMELKKKRR